jgi:SpoIID/LytB domain protein
MQLTGVQPASAYPTPTISLNGHGFGHGRGLSQYGSLGYAIDHNWSWEQILDHYYGGTSFGDLATNPVIGVRILEFDGKDFVVTANEPFNVGGQNYAANEAARVRRIGVNNFAIEKGPNCAGPWTQVATSGGPVIANPPSATPGDSENKMLRMCVPTSGSTPAAIRGVRGTISAIDDNGTIRTINSLHVEDYLRGVVPRESPASWGDLGGGKGMNALRAQSVAARSYVLAAASYSYATTCNTQACQVYGGAFLNGAYIEDARTNQAIADTAGKVRRNGSGAVARTEFSSSSGGYTAGGAFTAVVDDGDDYSGNTNHNWSATVNVSAIEAAYPSLGQLQAIQVTARNGLGDMGGRITGLLMTGSNASVSTTGLDFRTKLGLKSDWFTIVNVPSGGVNGYWMLGDDGGVFTFGNAQFYGSMGGLPLNKPIVALVPTPSGRGYYEVASDGGLFTYGDAVFHGSMGGKPLNMPFVGMAPTRSYGGYWLVASDGGIFAFGDAAFYGSMGGAPLNKPIVGMTASPSGKGYWFVASDGGIFAYGDAAFFGSTGGQSLRKPIVAMASTPTGAGYWLAASDGGIFAYGNAGFFGSVPGSNPNATITGMAATFDGGGYMLVGNKGDVYSYGSAPQFGNLSGPLPGYRGTVLNIAASKE